jgi:RNA polymerase sigma-70 factor (ECF subfamily)
MTAPDDTFRPGASASPPDAVTSGAGALADWQAQTAFVKRLAAGLLHDDALAEDVAQDSTMRVLRANSPAGAHSWRALFATIGRRLAIDAGIAKARRARREARVAQDVRMERGAPSPVEIAAREELRRKVLAAVLELESKQRDVVLLRFFEDFDGNAIARRLAIPVETVRTRLKRAAAILRARLASEDRAWRKGLLALAGDRGARVAWSGGFAAGGVVVTKKWVAGAALILVIGFASWRLAIDRDEPSATLGRESLERPVVVLTPGAADEVVEPATPRATIDVESGAPAPTLVTLRCIERDGTPVEGVRVALAEAPSESPLGTATEIGAGRTDSHGLARFASSGFASESLLRIVLEHADYEVREIHFPAVTGGENGESASRLELGEFVLDSAGTLEGFVIDEHGKGVGRIEVFAAKPRGPAAFWWRLGAVPLATNRTSDDGSFVLTSVPLGSVHVYARLSNGHYERSELIAVQAGRENAPLTVLVSRARANRIVVLTKSEEGTPLADADLRFHSELDGTVVGSGGRTDSEGRYVGIVEGDEVFEIQFVDGHGMRDSASGVRAGGIPVELIATNGPWIEVLTQNEERVPIHGAIVEVVDATGSSLRLASENGRSQFLRPKEPLKVRIRAAGFEPTERLVEPHHSDSSIVVSLRVIPMLRGRVESNGKPIAGAVIRVLEAHPFWSEPSGNQLPLIVSQLRPATSIDEGEWVDRASTDVEGRFAMRLSADDARDALKLAATAAGYAPTISPTFQLDVVRALPEFVLELGRGGAIAGRVVVPPGRSPDKVLVEAWSVTGLTSHARADAEGRYSIQNLGPGRYQVLPIDGHSVRRIVGKDVATNFPIEVFEGRVTSHDLFIDPPSARSATAHLSGRVLVDGSARAGIRLQVRQRDARLRPSDRQPRTAPPWQGVDVNALGRYDFPALDPGEYELKLVNLATRPRPIFGSEKYEASVRITTHMRLDAGPNVRDFDLAVGTLEGRVTSNRRATIALRGERPGGLHFDADVEPSADGSFHFDFVPAGPIHLTFDNRTRDIHIPAGSTATVDLP